MWKYNENRPEQRNAEANATAAWLDRCGKKQEKLNRRRREAEQFDRYRRMVISATEHIPGIEKNGI